MGNCTFLCKITMKKADNWLVCKINRGPRVSLLYINLRNSQRIKLSLSNSHFLFTILCLNSIFFCKNLQLLRPIKMEITKRGMRSLCMIILQLHSNRNSLKKRWLIVEILWIVWRIYFCKRAAIMTSIWIWSNTIWKNRNYWNCSFY